MISERDRVYLGHILDCTTLIQTYTRTGKADFMANSLVQDAVLRRLQTMAESTQRLSEAPKLKAPLDRLARISRISQRSGSRLFRWNRP